MDPGLSPAKKKLRISSNRAKLGDDGHEGASHNAIPGNAESAKSGLSRSSSNEMGRQRDNTREESNAELAARTRSGRSPKLLDEPTTTDPRSFVQNMFGTVAFKMMEWLTPRNLEIMTRPEEKAATQPTESNSTSQSPSSDTPNGQSSPATSATDHDEEATEINNLTEHERECSSDTTVKSSIEKSLEESYLEISTQNHNMPGPLNGDVKSNGHADTIAYHESAPMHTPSPASLKRLDLDPQSPKGVLNLTTPKLADKTQLPTLSQQPLRSKSKPPRQSVLVNQALRLVGEPPSLPIVDALPLRSNIDTSRRSPNPEEERSMEDVDKTSNEIDVKDSGTMSTVAHPFLLERIPHPQSLSSLPIEVVDLISDILQTDETLEQHSLYPQRIGKSLKRHANEAVVLKRKSLRHIEFARFPVYLKHQWRAFIEQSLFSVLGDPESLLKSFSDDKKQMFDTQTIWYSMLRMTRVAPSIVFDSLWIVAGTLFRPPEKLGRYEWAKETQLPNSLEKPISNIDAARIINICLHALVAAAPHVTDARQLANMSRIRSHGIAMHGRDPSSLEPTILCLQYDDTFSDGLALRLARRVFSAIPTRRRYMELLELQQEIRSDENEEEDILEIILGSLKFLDLKTPPILNFSDVERDLHEKRVPTLILDWARTIMLQDWEGSAEVPCDGPFGGALATLAAICQNTILPFDKFPLTNNRQEQKVLTPWRYSLSNGVLRRASRFYRDACRLALL